MACIEGVRACLFDAYGTLLDIHSPAQQLAVRIGPDFAVFSELWRRKQLEYTWLRSLMGAHADFETVTAEALDYAFETHRIADAELKSDLMALYRTPKAYADAAPAISRLHELNIQTAVLSNGTPRPLRTAMDAAGLLFHDCDILSVEAVGVFKPAPQVYALATQRFQCEPQELVFVSANSWDAAGGAAFGLRAVHVNRAGAPRERLPAMPEVGITNLGELSALIG